MCRLTLESADVSDFHPSLSAGAERKARIPDEETNLNTAYHEGGHTLVAHFTKHADPVHKVTIMPRSRSLGHVSRLMGEPHFWCVGIFCDRLTSRLRCVSDKTC